MNRQNLSRWLLACAFLSYLSQLYWFGRRGIHQIAIDDTDYLGIARHIRNHQFYAAIQDFRSPLISWIVAAGSFFCKDYVLIGKVVGIGSFVLAAALLYVFTNNLWRSPLVASLAVLCFSLSRGLAAAAVGMVAPDFLLTTLVLSYFIALLGCLRRDEKRIWVLVGCIHALAFLAKAVALPWLAVCTASAVVTAHPWRHWPSRLALAGIIPLVVAGTWAGALDSKYGVFTTGTQFRVNYFQWVDKSVHRDRGKYLVLRDTRPTLDEYGVNDPMPPGSPAWHYPIQAKAAVTGLLANEVENLPRAIKETTILATPGGVLLFCLVVVQMIRRRSEKTAEFAITIAILGGIVSVIVAYCSLVFDGRYVYPVVPLLLAVGMGLFGGPADMATRAVKYTAASLIILGATASAVYPSSPFRKLDRDFQIPCYQAGAILRAYSGRGQTIASVGRGPYQGHGVGWEAGYKAAYFGDHWLIGVADELPDSASTAELLQDITKANPIAILVWGQRSDPRYSSLLNELTLRTAFVSTEVISDPSLGEVGSVAFRRKSQETIALRQCPKSDEAPRSRRQNHSD